jgi:hypothetical protein
VTVDMRPRVQRAAAQALSHLEDLARPREPPERVVETFNHHLEVTRRRLDEALWSKQRTFDLRHRSRRDNDRRHDTDGHTAN